MLITSYMQCEFGSRAPMGNQDELIIMSDISLVIKHYDTIPIIDTTFVDGVMIVDTTYKINPSGTSSSSSSVSKDLLNNNFRGLSSIREETLFSSDSGYDVFLNNTKISIKTNYTDHHFWNVFNFKFKEGRPYDKSDVEQEARVTVISEDLALKYFGRKDNVLEELIRIDDKQYKVIGLVETSRLSIPYLTSGMFIPHTNLVESYTDPYFGGYTMIYHVDSGADIKTVKKEIESRAKTIDQNLNPDYNEVAVNPATYTEMIAKMIYYDEDEEKSLSTMKAILLGLLSLFVLLPVLNLINLNVSRIMDRSSEIGVRKAFGATNSDILTQFVFENIVQTLLGGLIGFILVVITIYIINQGKYLGTMQLDIDLWFFAYSLIICLAFGILSGILPAWKMSKTHIVNALKSKQL